MLRTDPTAMVSLQTGVKMLSQEVELGKFYNLAVALAAFIPKYLRPAVNYSVPTTE